MISDEFKRARYEAADEYAKSIVDAVKFVDGWDACAKYILGSDEINELTLLVDFHEKWDDHLWARKDAKRVLESFSKKFEGLK
jgi:hypothetical protein